MKLNYSLLYIFLIVGLMVCTVLAKRSNKPIRGAVAWLETSLMLPILGNLIIILAETRTVSLIGHYIYFIGVDSAMLALVNFTNAYCQGIGDGSQKPTIMYVGLGADTLQLLMNPFFGHAFNIEIAAEDGDTYFKLVPYSGQTFHRIVDYLILFCVILIFILASVITPKIYRERYTMLLTSIIAVGLLQAYYIFSKSTYDRSVIGYGLYGLLIFYFAIHYRPLRLLDKVLSNIVSGFSDAFYIFDVSGNCIWANNEGCNLAQCEDNEYETITSKLMTMFGYAGDPNEHITKRKVGEGEDARFYILEENYVKDEKGKLNGSYLRIKDVTDEEHEIQARDIQIGKISQEAYRDSLTGVGNKSAYNNKVIEINAEIENGLTDFAVVMVDMNNLKRINDEYGHKAGDIYIKGCCHMICEAFKHSPVFRIGGDEFVVILRGQDFDTRLQSVQELRVAFMESFEQDDVDPWFCYSAAVGIAEHASDDNFFELVFKRADQAMYEEKKKFKSLHGSYR